MTKEISKKQKLNYRYIKTANWIKIRPIVHDMPKQGTWVPLSIASILTNISTVMIRILCQNKIVECFSFRNSNVILCKIEDIREWINNKA